MELYDIAYDAQVTFRVEANRALVILRRTAVPVVGKLTSAQRAHAIKAKRNSVHRELKDKLTMLTKEVLEATLSNYMATISCLNDDLRACKKLHVETSDKTRRAGISRLATPTDAGDKRPSQGLELDSTFTSNSSDQPMSNEVWHHQGNEYGNIDHLVVE